MSWRGLVNILFTVEAGLLVNIGDKSELLISYLIMGCFYDWRDLADQAADQQRARTWLWQLLM